MVIAGANWAESIAWFSPEPKQTKMKNFNTKFRFQNRTHVVECWTLWMLMMKTKGWWWILITELLFNSINFWAKFPSISSWRKSNERKSHLFFGYSFSLVMIDILRPTDSRRVAIHQFWGSSIVSSSYSHWWQTTWKKRDTVLFR